MCLIGLEAFVGYGMGGIPLQSVFFFISLYSKVGSLAMLYHGALLAL
jgi:hypothetical protein